MSLLTDERLEKMLDAVGADGAQIINPAAPGVVVATIPGVLIKNFTQFDSDDTFNTQYEHSVDGASFQCRTLDAPDSIAIGFQLRLTGPGYQHREGAGEPNLYVIQDKRPDGHGMTNLVLNR